MDPSLQQSRFPCANCHKSFASTQSLKVHSLKCRRCIICKKVFTGTRYRTGVGNFEAHQDMCIRRALNIPLAMGQASNHPSPAMDGVSRMHTLPSSSRNYGDAYLNQTSYMDHLSQQIFDNGFNNVVNIQVEPQSLASIQPDRFSETQDLGSIANQLEQDIQSRLSAQLNSSGPQLDLEASVGMQIPVIQRASSGEQAMLAPASQPIFFPQNQTSVERMLPTSFRDLDYALSMPFTQMQPSSGVHEMEMSSIPSLKGHTHSHEGVNEKELGRADEMPPMLASSGSVNSLEATLGKAGIPEVNQVEVDSSQIIPLSLRKPGSSKVLDKKEIFSPFPSEASPLDRMCLVPSEHLFENTWGAGDELSVIQALKVTGNNTDKTMEAENMQVGAIHGNSLRVQDIMASRAGFSWGQGNQGSREDDSNNQSLSTQDAWLFSDSLWNW